ncbi:hypothetical protein ABTQ33_03850 [Paucilactobacillus suebicus]|uniref:Polysaccharide polymerase n=1 Tax=Paucilactobacillus suebicus DSM 5007 = KCTC 3549 TaxID=1423807 RepID=A0A0R1W638_9LACO|nr:hypothetical protein [Paucilactobacillus suebicus]KRM13278.1 hypothetical protein FD16_GL000752 [Paucilactobacillus suebicus DSM 5007 = KCTC 3549]
MVIISRIKNSMSDVKINGQTIYITAFIIYLVSAFLKTSMITPAYFSIHLLNYCAYLAIALLFLKLAFFTSYSFEQILFTGFVLLFFGLSWMKSSSPLAFYTGAFLVSASDIDFDEIIKTYFVVGLVMLVVVIALAELHVIKNLVYVRGDKIRESFGILYPTDFASHVFYLVLSYLYIKKGQIRTGSYIFIFLIGILIYVLTDARLDSVLIFLVIPVNLICSKYAFKDGGSGLSIADTIWPATGIFAYFAIFSTIFFKNESIFAILNRLISSRISLSHLGYMKYGIPLIGQRIKEHGWGGSSGYKNFNAGGGLHQYFMLDSSFVRLLLIYGVVVFISVIAVVAIMAYQATAMKDYVFVGILFLISLSCLIDQHMLEIAYNPFYIAAYSIFNRYIKTRKVGNTNE